MTYTDQSMYVPRTEGEDGAAGGSDGTMVKYDGATRET
jgi:hypothetical protein